MDDKKGYANGNAGLRLTHLKARINELIRSGTLKSEIHPFAYTKIPTADPKECDLTIEEFLKIRNSNIDGKRMNLGKGYVTIILLSMWDKSKGLACCQSFRRYIILWKNKDCEYKGWKLKYNDTDT